MSGLWSIRKHHSKCQVSGPQGDFTAGIGSLVHREALQKVSGLWSTGGPYSRCRVSGPQGGATTGVGCSGPQGGTTAGVGSVVHRETLLQVSGLWSTGILYRKCRVSGPQGGATTGVGCSGPQGGTTAGVGSLVHRETLLQVSGLWSTGRHYCKCRVCGPQGYSTSSVGSLVHGETLQQVSGLWSTGPSLWSTGCIVLRTESQAMPLMVTMAQAFGVAAVWHCAVI